MPLSPLFTTNRLAQYIPGWFHVLCLMTGMVAEAVGVITGVIIQGHFVQKHRTAGTCDKGQDLSNHTTLSTDSLINQVLSLSHLSLSLSPFVFPLDIAKLTIYTVLLYCHFIWCLCFCTVSNQNVGIFSQITSYRDASMTIISIYIICILVCVLGTKEQKGRYQTKSEI